MSRNLHFFYYLFPTAEAWRHPEQADNVYWVFFFWSVGAAHRSGPQAELSAGWMTMNRVSDRCRITDKHRESSSMLHKFCSYRNFPGSHLGKVLRAAFVEKRKSKCRSTVTSSKGPPGCIKLIRRSILGSSWRWLWRVCTLAPCCCRLPHLSERTR